MNGLTRDPRWHPFAGMERSTPGHTLALALETVRRRIADAARAHGRDPAGVRLVAVSKFHPAASVQAALAAGQRIFGENRVQEAQEKFPALRTTYPDLALHVIGGLQSNKVRAAVAVADVIETLDRPKLADALETAAQQEGRLPKLLIQVNVGDEPQKGGIRLPEADRFIAAMQARFGTAVTGLMCIPPAEEDPVPHFRWLAAAAARHGLGVLSMGMSGDFEAAIGCGATHVRIGSAIFGDRPATPAGGRDAPPAL